MARIGIGTQKTFLLLCAFVVTYAPAALAGEEPLGLAAIAAIEQTLVETIAGAEKSVVAIARIRKSSSPLDGVDDEDDRLPLRGFGTSRVGPESPDFVPNDYGTGVIVDAAGLILTAYHVLGDVEKSNYWVWAGRKPYPAQVRAADPWQDLAVLKINASELEPIVFGDASSVRKGQIVIGLGNPLAIARDGQASAAWGIVSNLSRKAPGGSAREATRVGETLHQYGTLIQTDMRLNLGTSGGALLNLKGEMIGLTTSLAALEGAESSAGFAMPVDESFKRAVETLKTGRKPDYGFLGVAPSMLSISERQAGRIGVRVESVVAGTPGYRAGLRADDLITHVGRVPIVEPADLIRELSRMAVESRVELSVQRGGNDRRSSQTLKLTAELSKKYIAGPRKTYAEVEDPEWRGLKVDYATAVPSFHEWVSKVDPEGCVAVIDVEKDSSAWAVGLRPITFVTHVESARVSTPREFHSAVAHRDGPVRVRITGASGPSAIRTILP